MADYPTAVHTFEDVVDNVDLVEAAHVNSAHDEIIAIQNRLHLLVDDSPEWKFDRDYIEGLRANYKDVNNVTISPGYCSIGGVIGFLEEAVDINENDDMFPDEAYVANKKYNVYVHIVDGALVPVLSQSEPGADFLHPNDTSYRYISTCFILANNNFWTMYHYGDTIYIPYTSIKSNAGTYAWTSNSISAFAPSCVVGAHLLLFNTSSAATEADMSVGPNGSKITTFYQYRIYGLASGKTMMTPVYCPVWGQYVYSVVAKGAQNYVYLLGYNIKRKRYD